jgi:hypothetical protein
MSTPNPVPEKTQAMQPVPPPPGGMPSDSTSLSAVGGAIAVVVMSVLGSKGITFPAGMEAAIAVIASVILGYLPPSGRK